MLRLVIALVVFSFGLPIHAQHVDLFVVTYIVIGGETIVVVL